MIADSNAFATVGRWRSIAGHTLAALALLSAAPVDARPQWTRAEAKSWYAGQPWLIGANYLPANAINQLEMWQADTFDPALIDRELGWAQARGLNTMRVFLHDLLWQQDPEGFAKRIDAFLAIADRHGIKPMLVLFDSCWDPRPKLGPQHPPIPGITNSSWVQSPGTDALADTGKHPRLEAYTKGIIGRFARDRRILAWDVWNEPDSPASTYPGQPKNKEALVAALLPRVFAWARAADPMQPVTSGIAWGDDWTPAGKHTVIESTQLTQSDVITFHEYAFPEKFADRIRQLSGHGRPIIATETMARPLGSTLDTILPIARQQNVGVYVWGFVNGRSQTHLPWDSWKRPYTEEEPPIWFHDLLRGDGTPYRQAEMDLIRDLKTNAGMAAPARRR